MRHKWMTSWTWVVLIAYACSAAPGTSPTLTSVPTQPPTQTGEPVAVTPLESAFAPGNPTAAPSEEMAASRTVAFDTPDGATITAELYGSGRTAVVFSVMGNCRRGWEELAEKVAQNERIALTYQWRDCRASGRVNENELQKNFLNDARGAIEFMRAQGVEQIILAGASLGGLASAKLAIESDASGLVIFASPSGIARWNFQIEPGDLDTDIPKLFLSAENDTVVPLASSRALHDLAADPKEWQTYPGTAHGTDLFDEENGEEAQQRILEFILSISPVNP